MQSLMLRLQVVEYVNSLPGPPGSKLSPHLSLARRDSSVLSSDCFSPPPRSWWSPILPPPRRHEPPVKDSSPETYEDLNQSRSRSEDASQLLYSWLLL